MVLLAPEGEEGPLLVALGEQFFGDGGFARGEDRDAFLVLVQAVALVLHVEDCSGGRVLDERTAWYWWWRNALILRGYLAASISHICCTYACIEIKHWSYNPRCALCW